MPTNGREFFKIIHKNGFFMLYHLRRKIFFQNPYIFRVLVIYPLRKEFFWEWLPKRPLPVGISREKNFGRTLKNTLSHSSLNEDVYLDNWIKSPSSMTVRWPRKSERGDAAVRSRGRHTKGARKSGAYSAISKYLSNYLLLPEKKKNIGNCNSFQNR